MAYAAGAMALMRYLTKGALRQTKLLSPYKSSKVYADGVKVKKGKKLKNIKTGFVGIKDKTSKTMKTKQELTMIGSGINRGLKSVGVSARNRSKALAGYNTGYKHLRKNKKLYGSAVAGGVAFDIFDDD